jgi:trimethylamine monooxygenase
MLSCIINLDTISKMGDSQLERKRVAIIGAGPSGISVLDSFAALAATGCDVPEIVCFERQNAAGGLWNFTDTTGTDSYGEPIHTSMYKHLWANSPKEVNELAGYTFDEHFGKPTGSYPPREAMAGYILGRMTKHGLEQFIRFRTPIRSVIYDDETCKFTVSWEQLETNTTG